jgi:threonine/homoserine/homoserine lactone efflux protein
MAAALALNVTPGPDMLYVAGRSIGEGRLAGVVSSLGIAAGTLFHIAALAFGLSALLAAVPLAYDVVRWAGAAYLIYLGIRALVRPVPLGEITTVAQASLGAVFRQGLVTNVLNPKVALFFLAFLPQFVDPSRGSAAAQTVLLGLLFNTSGALVNVAVALGASAATLHLRRNRGWGLALQRVTGGLFVALGLRLALSGRR